MRSRILRERGLALELVPGLAAALAWRLASAARLVLRGRRRSTSNHSATCSVLVARPVRAGE